MSALPQAPRLLSDDAYRRIEREIAKYPEGRQQSAVMAALAIAQEELGWISPETIEEVAARLDMPPIAVYEVATFYSMYNLKPVGRHKITLCTNLPCQLSGANAAAQRLKSRLGIGFGETTADGAFTLREGECMGACGDAPVMVLDDRRMCSFMSDERIDALLDQLSEPPSGGAGGEEAGGSKP